MVFYNHFTDYTGSRRLCKVKKIFSQKRLRNGLDALYSRCINHSFDTFTPPRLRLSLIHKVFPTPGVGEVDENTNQVIQYINDIQESSSSAWGIFSYL